VAATGLSWKIRNNSILTHSNLTTKLSLPRKEDKSKLIDKILREEDKLSNQAKLIPRLLNKDADRINQSQILMKGIRDLRRLNLLMGKGIQKIKFQGVIR
jgi:hypothetical protein